MCRHLKLVSNNLFLEKLTANKLLLHGGAECNLGNIFLVSYIFQFISQAFR